MYRLAHFLEIAPLRKTALDALVGLLTTSKVLWEMLSDFSQDHHEVLQAEADFAVKHWEELVKGGYLMKILSLIPKDSWDDACKKEKLLDRVKNMVLSHRFDLTTDSELGLDEGYAGGLDAASEAGSEDCDEI